MANKQLNNRLSQKVNELLNQQIQHENNTSMQYLQMACWAEQNGYVHSAQFLYKQSEEERKHMLKIISYVTDMGGNVAIEHAMTPIKKNFNSLEELFVTALEAEINTSQSIANIVEFCLNSKDFMTFGFLQWFITEEVEEETVARRNLELFELAKQPEGQGLYIIDQAIGTIAK